LLFQRKQSQLATGAIRGLQQLAGTLVQIENRLKVTGHTDSAPVINGKYRSNWELSMARARIVAGILTDSGYIHPVTVLGFADTGGPPVTSSRRQRENLIERVDIVILTERRDTGPHDIF